MLTALRGSKLCVLSTISNEQPQSALVAFAEDARGNVYFQSQKHSRKNQNISKNCRVSLVVGWELETLITLQYEGVAQKVIPGHIERSKELFLKKKSPSTIEYLNHPDAVFYGIQIILKIPCGKLL